MDKIFMIAVPVLMGAAFVVMVWIDIFYHRK